MKEKSDEQLAGSLVLPPNFDLSAVTLEVLLILNITERNVFNDTDIAFALAARNHVRSTIARMVEVATVKPVESSS